jgi:hypothetical protein
LTRPDTRRKRALEIRTVIVIRQHYDVREFSEEPDYSIYAVSIRPRGNSDRVLVQFLLARLKIMLIRARSTPFTHIP